MIATLCAAVRNCCAAFSYELRGRAAAQLRGNIALYVSLSLCPYLFLSPPFPFTAQSVP